MAFSQHTRLFPFTFDTCALYTSLFMTKRYTPLLALGGLASYLPHSFANDQSTCFLTKQLQTNETSTTHTNRSAGRLSSHHKHNGRSPLARGRQGRPQALQQAPPEWLSRSRHTKEAHERFKQAASLRTDSGDPHGHRHTPCVPLCLCRPQAGLHGGPRSLHPKHQSRW